MHSVPVNFGDAFEGFAEVDGLIRTEGDFLVLEFETRDAIFGVIRSGPGRIDIPVSDIAAIELDKGMWKTHINLRVNRLGAIADLPSHRQGEVRLSVKKRHREAAADLVADVALRVSEHRLASLERRSEPTSEP